MRSMHSQTEFETLVEASNEVLRAKEAADAAMVRLEQLLSAAEAARDHFTKLNRDYHAARTRLADLAARVPITEEG